MVRYRPANGTEGALFDDAWCSYCARDAEYRAQGDDGDITIACRIITDAFAYDIDHPNYPKEWVYGLDGRPKCTAFACDTSRPMRCNLTLDMFGASAE
jgi:hypothetical protein